MFSKNFRVIAACFGLCGALALTHCQTTDDITQDEAKQAIDESNWSTTSAALTAEVSEISTHFTIGQVVQKSAEKLRDFVKTEIPCAKLTLADAKLTIEFGVVSDKCTWHGHAISGTTTIAVDRNSDGDVQVTHTWDKLANGQVSISGSAVVTWQSSIGTRHIVHNLTATALDNSGKVLTGSGDRTQKLIDASKGWLGGIQIDGTRKWTTAEAQWDLAIAGVQIRGMDPVPQAGSYSLMLPSGKTMVMAFARLDSKTITVTVTGLKKTFSFNIVSLQ